MKLDEVIILNDLLKVADGFNKKHEIFVDNLHSPYALMESEYVLPATQIHAPDFQSVSEYVKTLCEFIPEAVKDCNVLPESRPKRETGKISLVKEIHLGDLQYLYIAKFDIAHLGGAEKESIVKNATQYTNVSVRTNRIYFSIRIIPVREVYRESGQIVDFNVINYDPSLFHISTEKQADSARRIVSEIFDEIDFSTANRKIHEELRINPENWAPGKVYEPAAIEFLTLSLRFLVLSFGEMLADFKSFHETIGFIFAGKKYPPEIAVENYVIWLKKFGAERLISPSGNMLWRITKK